MSGEGGICDKGGCCVLVAKILGGLFAPCVVLLSCFADLPFFYLICFCTDLYV